jgi:hypothetical protein
MRCPPKDNASPHITPRKITTMNHFTIRTIAATLIIGTTISAIPLTAHPGHDTHNHQATTPAAPALKANPMPSMAAPMDHDHGAMAQPLHGRIAIPDGQAIPMVKLMVTPDSLAGWNMEIQLTNFGFNPAQMNQSSKPTEGHAHLLLNDRKVARIYGTWNHIPKLPKGQNVLKVVLMTNKHETLTTNGQPIGGQVTIDVP